MNKVKFPIAVLIVLFSFHSFAQKGKSVIYFEDGTIKKCHVENIHNYKRNNKFKKPVSIIELNDEKSNKLIIYEYLQLKKGKKEFLARIIYKGQKANLYSRHILHNKRVEYPNPSEASSENPSADIHYAKKLTKSIV